MSFAMRCLRSCCSVRWGCAKGHGHGTGPDDGADAMSTNTVQGGLDVVRRPGEAEAPGVVAAVGDVAAGAIEGLVDRAARDRIARDVELHEGQLELEMGGVRQVADL